MEESKLIINNNNSLSNNIGNSNNNNNSLNNIETNNLSNNNSEYYIILCPHCSAEILIFKNEIACAIFRHGIYKSNGQQLNPHASKEECENAFNTGIIFGCGKPFRVSLNSNGLTAEECDYI